MNFSPVGSIAAVSPTRRRWWGTTGPGRAQSARQQREHRRPQGRCSGPIQRV